MASDSRPARIRHGSNGLPAPDRSLGLHIRHPSRPAIKPKSTHTSDPFLAPDFLSPSFDPADYLNSTLPPLQNSGPSAASSKLGRQPVPLTELSSQAQALSSRLSGHMTRLSDALAVLTDEILRGGGRLAYEVELLRGETLSLTEAITDQLQDEIRVFVPAGIQNVAENGPSSSSDGRPRRSSVVPHQNPRALVPPPARAPALALVPPTPNPAFSFAAAKSATTTPPTEEDDMKDEPAYVSQLHSLTVARARLDQVIKTFGRAIEFNFPPSEMSVSSSFLSVSAPEPGSARQSSEEKGRHVLNALRAEIGHMLADPEDPVGGVERATGRVEQLKELATVWSGTAEEKGRTRFIETLAKMVEDRHRELLRGMEQQQQQQHQQQARRDGKPESETTRAAGKGAAAPLAAAADGTGAESRGYSSLLQRIRGI